jgi:hypothetical protein
VTNCAGELGITASAEPYEVEDIILLRSVAFIEAGIGALTDELQIATPHVWRCSELITGQCHQPPLRTH